MANKQSLFLGAVAGALTGLFLGRLISPAGSKGDLGLAWRIMRRLNPQVAQAYRPDGPNSDLVLVLTTTGRKTGRSHVTPLQYEAIDNALYVAAARGRQADWFRNIENDPRVMVEVKDARFPALATPITDPERIAAYLEMRRRRHPLMIRAMLLLHGLPLKAGPDDLLRLARKLALVILRPETAGGPEPAGASEVRLDDTGVEE